jgi:hypothetical protein
MPPVQQSILMTLIIVLSQLDRHICADALGPNYLLQFVIAAADSFMFNETCLYIHTVSAKQQSLYMHNAWFI